MVVSYGDLLVVVIAFFGLVGAIRGVRSIALMTGAIFFAIVAVTFSGDLVMQGFQKLGLALNTPDTQAIFKACLFVFAAWMATIVLGRIVNVPTRGLPRSHRFYGLLVGLVNGFLIMAMLEQYMTQIIAATGKPGKPVSVGMPALHFTHPTPGSWSITLEPSTFTLLPTADSTLWNKLPVALVLLLLFLAFVFAGTLYTRLSGSRS